MKNQTAIDAKFALSHPIRIKTMSLLSQQAMTLSQVARELDLHPANLAYHFNVLKNAKLIYLVEEKDLGRNIEKYYLALELE